MFLEKLNERLVEMKTSQYNLQRNGMRTVFENLNFSDNVGGGAVPIDFINLSCGNETTKSRGFEQTTMFAVALFAPLV